LIQAFQFQQETELFSINSTNNSRIIKLHFDPFGIRLGGAEAKGDLHLWKCEDVSQVSLLKTLKSTHSNGLYDFCFLNSPNVIATSGMSSTFKYVFFYFFFIYVNNI
jgi:hypothetical protein